MGVKILFSDLLDIITIPFERKDDYFFTPWADEFVFIHSLPLVSFFCCSIFILGTISGWLFSRWLDYLYKTKRKIFNGTFSNTNWEELPINQLGLNNLNASYQAYKKFLSRLMARQREHAQYIYASLDIVYESFKNPAVRVSEEERGEIIHSCLILANSLSGGFIAKIKNETVILGEMLEKIKCIFEEKISRSNIYVQVVCPENLFFKGDSLFIEFIFLNFIGRSIYLSPKNEKIDILVKEHEGELKLKIKDRGYSLAYTEKLIKKAFYHFIKKDILRTVCKENGLIYECQTTQDGLNITTLTIPADPL